MTDKRGRLPVIGVYFDKRLPLPGIELNGHPIARTHSEMRQAAAQAIKAVGPGNGFVAEFPRKIDVKLNQPPGNTPLAEAVATGAELLQKYAAGIQSALRAADIPVFRGVEEPQPTQVTVIPNLIGLTPATPGIPLNQRPNGIVPAGWQVVGIVEARELRRLPPRIGVFVNGVISTMHDTGGVLIGDMDAEHLSIDDSRQQLVIHDPDRTLWYRSGDTVSPEFNLWHGPAEFTRTRKLTIEQNTNTDYL